MDPLIFFNCKHDMSDKILKILKGPSFHPPWKGVGKEIEKSVRKALYEFSMLENECKVGIALSGGKDSLTLMAMLAAISGRGFPKIELHAFFVDGPFTCGAGVNKQSLEDYCSSLSIPLHVLTSTQTLETLECYGCSRERRGLIFKTAKSLGIETLAFGHHRDDLVETTLMNLFVKGDFAGMLPKIPMKKYGITIIRPLIFAQEKAIIEFAKTQGFLRITCGCPVGQKSKRKNTKDLILEILEHFPHAVNNIEHAVLRQGSLAALEP